MIEGIKVTKSIKIEFKQSLDIRAPEQCEMKVEGFADPLEVLITLQNMQNQVIGQMAQMRDQALMQAQMAHAQTNGLMKVGH